MIQEWIELLIIILLAIILVWAVYRIIKKIRYGGGCCGELEQSERPVSVKDRNKSHYPYAADLKITGMTCRNCAQKVQNALNELDGVWAMVDLNSHTAHIRLKQKPNIDQLCSIIAKAEPL